MTVKAIKGLGKAYEKFISRGKDLPYDSKKIGKMLDEVSGKFKKAGVTGDKSKTKDFDKIINQKAPTPSKAGSAPTKKSMDFEKDSSGVVTPKPSGKKTETEAYLKKIKSKQTKPPMARMEYIIEAEDAEGLKRIKKKEQVIGEKKR